MIGIKFAATLAVSLVLLSVSSLTALAKTGAPSSPPASGHIQTTASPEIRVTAKVDNSKRATLYGHVSGKLRHAKDMGRLAQSTPAEHMILVLKSSDSQKAELRRVLDEQQDSRTANYHQWVTPEEFGDHFGVHDADIAKVSAWLQSQGFTVEDVSKSKRVLTFSGTTGQLEKAFQTEMHNYTVHGEAHVSNNSEITVPTALSPVIAGISLHNFFRKGHMGPVRHLRDVRENPLYTSSSTVHYVGPWDFATIYNTFPLLNAGITGAGSSIAIVGRSDILLSDVQAYRSMFNLPVNDPIFIHAGQDNGIQPGDDGESDLDVEISGGIAQEAQVYFVIGTPTFLVDGITNSIQYIVENNLADIISISYGECEADEGTGGNAFDSQAFEQAAAQGISIFVAAGDNGPAECDDQNDSYENLGYATGAESSTWYNVSVGGSGLAESLTTAVPSSITTTSTTGPEYWNTNAALSDPYPALSAKFYIPETPWNISKVADYSADPSGDLAGLWSGSGGISSYYLQPPWQRGSGVYSTDPVPTQGGDWVTGYTITNPGSGYTSTPAITLGSGCLTKPALTAVISGGSVIRLSVNYGTQGGTLAGGQGFGCTSVPSITFSAPPSGTTATATLTIGPMWNTPPLISGVPHRYTPDLVLNADDGNDATIFCSEGVCEVSGTTLEDAGLVGGTSVAAPSMAGIQALINQANGGRQGAPNYIYYALSAAQTESGCNSAAQVYSVEPLGATCAFHDITLGDNLICGESSCTKGTYPSALSATKMGWLAGTGYDLATGLGSVNATNLSNQWQNVVFNSSNTTLNLSQTSGITQGGSVTFSGTVVAGSGNGTPTGDVAFILSQGDLGQTINVNTGAWNGSGTGAFTTLSGGSYSATVSNLPAGTYTVTARYSGDETYASSLSAPVTVTVGTGNATVTITPEWFNDTVTCTLNYVTSYNYGQFAWIPAAVTATSGQGVPTGTVAFTVDGTPWGTETLDPQGNAYLASGTIGTSSCLYDYMFAQGPTLSGGTHTIGASYSGDSTFSPATATPVVITVNPIGETGTVTTSSLYITSGASVLLTGTFTTTALTGTSTQQSGPTGTVSFTDSTTSTVLGTATVIPTVSFSGNTYTFGSYAALSTTAITTSGANSVTATYSGDNNFLSASTSTPLTITVGTLPATTTAVTSSGNPTTLNGRPTLTATVTGTPAVTSGTVSFYDNYTGTLVLLGQGTVGSAHTTTYRPASGAAFWGGAHPITAVFAGISTNSASTSPVFTQSVTLGTTTIVLDGKTVGGVGQNFTFAAVLTPSQTNATYAPNQNVVTFYDGSTAIGTAKPITVTSTQGGYGLWTATLTVNNLSPGTHTITAKYNDINYSLATSNALTVTVAGATETISWTPPAAITYPAPLTTTQLDASDTVAGTFIYKPVAGTVLLPGTQTLAVSFSPTDTAHYAPQNTTVQLQVNKGTQTVTISPAAGTYNTPQTVTISDSVSGAVIYYTINGSTPTTGSPVYSGPITVTGVETVKAIATAGSYYLPSAVTTAAYVTPPATPTFSPAGGSYIGTQTVTLSDASPSSTIYFTTDASTPTTGSTVYSSPLTISATTTVRAMAASPYAANSAVANGIYTILIPAAMISPTSGSTLGSSQAFTWSAGFGVSHYELWVGNTAVGSSNLYNSGSVTVTTETVNGLPSNGQAVYVRLFSLINGSLEIDRLHLHGHRLADAGFHVHSHTGQHAGQLQPGLHLESGQRGHAL